MHDMWGFTGGCHTTGTCIRYQQQCGLCPALHSQREQDISRRVWQQKAKHWTPDLFTIVAPSHWLATEVRNSLLLRDFTTEVIPNPIDTTIFQPLNRQFARKALHMPEDKSLILFGATDLFDPNKGLDLLLAALQKSSALDTMELVVFGAGKAERIVTPVPIHAMGAIQDERLLALLYNAVDMVVVPSRQESFGQVAAEALACGTPCVAFAATGLIDVIDHQQNGYLAQPYEVDDLAKAMEWVLSEADATALSHNAREKVLSHYSMDVVAKQYIAIYERILKEQ
jgi:glycosyltransferase involved in cell wall biosynthesis